ncbi:helix-turn-helix transcriptional regulator [Peptacetobacter hiranonis]|uniref:helix-turn-helix domain-containing protein n=1 Tax=Peptacetobacter hiranonis TaxID=89152 RepID=UPI002E792A80|nr:helix-turn-helix transcriptional regulator [Peptacetobacter hiranonis]MEE0247543.1 helix-turn-helix transcriptional regulator [Peptacetobacter hiranonis]
MEFNEKLQYFRKKSNLTQEELAEKLFVSRTAISKWESGRGMPSISSLKAISEVFNVSIDELLSSEEIIEAAEKEKKENMKSFKNIIFGIIDLMSIIFLFIPLFGKEINGYIYLVNLFSINRVGKYIYLIIIGVTILYGVSELIMSKFENKSVDKINSIISLGLTSIAIITFIATIEPYIAFIEFWIFLIKIVVYIKQSK